MTLLETIPPYWESVRTVFYARMGNPTTPEGKAQLERQSPLNSAGRRSRRRCWWCRARTIRA